MITILHNPRCRKSREGLQILEASGQHFEVVNYLKTPLTAPQLKNIISKLNIAPIDLVRTNEAIWKSDYKGKPLDDDAVIAAMLTHPKLIERPIVVTETNAVVGRPAEKINDII